MTSSWSFILQAFRLFTTDHQENAIKLCGLSSRSSAQFAVRWDPIHIINIISAVVLITYRSYHWSTLFILIYVHQFELEVFLSLLLCDRYTVNDSSEDRRSFIFRVSSNDINLNYSEPWSMSHGMSPTILFTRICISHTFALYSRKGSLNIAQLSLHTLTPSWIHYYGQCSTEGSNDDGRLTGCSKEAPLDAFLEHRQP